MVLTPHILAGAVIGSQFSSPATVFILSFISHYFLEIFPHYEYEPRDSELKKKNPQLNKKFLFALSRVCFDFSFGLILSLYLAWGKPYLAMSFIGALTATIPDGLLFLYWRNADNFLLKFFALPHHFLHFFKTRSPAWLGLTIEIIITIFLIVFLANAN